MSQTVETQVKNNKSDIKINRVRSPRPNIAYENTIPGLSSAIGALSRRLIGDAAQSSAEIEDGTDSVLISQRFSG
jgi:hypothetical protein